MTGSVIYLTARNPTLGQEALQKLEAELGPKKTSEVQFHQLDITEWQSCTKLAEHLQQKHAGLDILINNAGFAFKNDATEPAGVQADVSVAINYYGTKQVTEALAPLIRSGGRIVNICSQVGIMGDKYTKKELIDKFASPDFTVEDVDNFVEEYKRLAHENRVNEGGYPTTSYGVSKTAEIALSMVQARDRELNSKGITVNACCPGYVDTDMTSHKGHLTIDQGAETPIWLAMAPDIPSGAFVYKKEVKNWLHDGKMTF